MARRAAAPFAAALCWMAASAAGCGGGAAPGASGPRAPVTAMTRNLYLGADLGALVKIQTPDQIPAAMAPIYAAILATDFPARAKLLADEIVSAAPDLVGLQEVSLYRKQTPSDWRAGDPPNASDVMLDFLASLQDELAARGASYDVANVATNGDAELPVDDGGGGAFDLRLTDRDVILARAGVTTANATSTPYVNRLNIPIGGLTGPVLSFQRSYSTVEAVVDAGMGTGAGAAHLTFATSHLEIGEVAPVQIGQAQEMLAGLAKIQGPLLLVGDFNSPATPASTTAYPLLKAQFHDAYGEAHPGDPGLTCCQAPDLLNATSQDDERVDLILFRGDFQIASVGLVGNDPAVRTPSGLWPTDHFGVAGTLEVRAN